MYSNGQDYWVRLYDVLVPCRSNEPDQHTAIVTAESQRITQSNLGVPFLGLEGHEIQFRITAFIYVSGDFQTVSYRSALPERSLCNVQ